MPAVAETDPEYFSMLLYTLPVEVEMKWCTFSCWFSHALLLHCSPLSRKIRTLFPILLMSSSLEQCSGYKKCFILKTLREKLMGDLTLGSFWTLLWTQKCFIRKLTLELSWDFRINSGRQTHKFKQDSRDRCFKMQSRMNGCFLQWIKGMKK